MLLVNTTDVGRPYQVISLVDGIGQANSPAEAKDMAVANMVQNAESMRADAVVNVRYSFASNMRGNILGAVLWEYNKIIASGTAVKFI